MPPLPPDDSRRPRPEDAVSPQEKLWRESMARTTLAERHGQLLTAAAKGQKLRVSFLYATHADTFANKAILNTALLRAADGGHRDVCQLLLKYGADAAHDNSHALIAAVKASNGYLVDDLLRAGAEMEDAKKHPPNVSLLCRALDGRHHEAAKALIRHGANLDEKDKMNRTMRVLARERGMTAALDEINRLWFTPPLVPGDFVAKQSLEQLRQTFPAHRNMTGFQLAAYNGQIEPLLEKLTAGGRRLGKSDLITATPHNMQTLLFILGQRRELNKVFRPALWHNDVKMMTEMLTYVPAGFRGQIDTSAFQVSIRQARLRRASTRTGRLPRAPNDGR